MCCVDWVLSIPSIHGESVADDRDIDQGFDSLNLARPGWTRRVHPEGLCDM